MSSLEEFVKLVGDRTQLIREKMVDNRKPLDEIFVDAIRQSLREVADEPEDFSEVTVLNFLVNSVHEGYSSVEIRAFMESELKH